MPKLKQPVPLQKMAFDVLLEFVVNYCDQLSVEGSPDELRQGISVVKKNVCSSLPWNLLGDLCDRFLEKFCRTTRPTGHHGVALEILMDMEIVGLRCKGPIMVHLDPKDVHRFQRLNELDLAHFPVTVPITLDNFHLDDLTTFIFPYECTDLELRVIGRNCSKLQVLKIEKSKVTDEGLRDLSPCSELRVVDIVGCPVSYTGINGLLSVHKNIEEFAHWNGTGDPKGGDVLSHLDSSVCPSISRFVLKIDRDFRPVNLQTVVAKFPNLTYLKIVGVITTDLSVLKSLNKLSGLEIEFEFEMFYDEVEETWGSLKELLTFIGPNITSLKLSCWDQGYLWYQDEVNFIFDSCPNIEYLGFDQGGGLVVIPPFQKLKELVPRIPIEFEQIEILDDPALEFSKLVNLETLSILNYGMNLQAIESIMLDDVKFPNLSVIETNCLKTEDLAQLERTARNNNLDLKIKNDPESNWYIEYRFGDGDTDDE